MQSLAKAALIALVAVLAAVPAQARKTVCTITVNSADEKETFRQRLPRGEYEFVELVEKGRGDWLRSACNRKVQCDALIVSGHFNAGDTFYSDNLEKNEYLEIDELERASCSASCPNLFSRLKEVYLFGCESLNPDATQYSSSHGESGRERMRRLFPNVPVIYGFSSSAPVGPTAAMLLNRYFDRGPGAELASGRRSSRLLQVFSRNNMVTVSGVRDSEPLAGERRQICRFFDDRLDAAGRASLVHEILRGDEKELVRRLRRVEKLVGAGDSAHARISSDGATRGRYLALARRTNDVALRARMIAVADALGWLDAEQHKSELVAMINDVLAGHKVGFPEVDLVCSLNKEGALDGELSRIASTSDKATHVAVRACMGSKDAQARMIRTLASPDEKEVQVAQAYLRHRPVKEHKELRAVAREIARMGGPAQVRALDTLARLHIADREILEDLSQAFAETRSAAVQRAIAEVFIRSDPQALPRRSVIATLRDHRVKPPGSGPDLIDALLARLQASG